MPKTVNAALMAKTKANAWTSKPTPRPRPLVPRPRHRPTTSLIAEHVVVIVWDNSYYLPMSISSLNVVSCSIDTATSVVVDGSIVTASSQLTVAETSLSVHRRGRCESMSTAYAPHVLLHSSCVALMDAASKKMYQLSTISIQSKFKE